MLAEKISHLGNMTKSHPNEAILLADSILCNLLNTSFDPLEKCTVFYLKGMANRALHNKPSALSDLQTALKICQELHPGDDSLKAEIMAQVGLAFGDFPDYDSSLAYQQRSLQMRIRLFGENSLQVVSAYNNLAGWYAGNSDIPSSLNLRNRALAIAIHLPGAEEVLIKLYNNIGRLHFVNGDFERARDFMHNALGALNGLGKNVPYTTAIYENLAEIYAALGESDQALELMRQSDVWYENNPGVTNRNNYFTALGRIYLAQGEPEKAIGCFENELDILQKHSPPHQRFLSLNSYARAECYLALGRFDEAMACADSNIVIEKGIGGKGPFGGYHLKGLACTGKADTLGARANFRRSLEANNFFGDVSKVHSFSAAIEVFKELGKLEYGKFQSSHETGALAESLHWLDLADQAITFRRRELFGANSKERISESAAPIYEMAVGVCVKLEELTGDKSYLEKAFYFSERRKSVVLSSSFQSSQASAEAGVQVECTEEQGELLRKIAFYRHQRTDLLQENYPDDAAKIAEADRLIQMLTLCFDSLLANIEQSCPALLDLKNQETSIPPEELRAWCSATHSTLLEYFLGSDRLFIFSINGEKGLQVKTLPLPPNFAQVFQQFRESISEVPLYEDDDVEVQRWQQFSESSRTLYEWLVAPVRSALLRRVMVIPDGPLAYIPFAALLEPAPVAERQFNLAAYPYLVKSHAFGYCYSATLMRQMESKKHLWEGDTATFCAIAPDFVSEKWALYRSADPPGENLQLTNNMLEARLLWQMLGGTLLMGQQAKRENLLSNIHARILHFSTHAFAFDLNSEQSYLALPDGKNPDKIHPLYLWEIPYLPLDADLVFLSACKTGLGKLTKTEGIISLARAFAFGGAKNVHATLWSVKDHLDGLGLVEGFYKNMQQGHLPKDLAMQQAQVSYLENHNSSTFAHPHYWAAYIGIGDRSALFPLR